MRRVKKGMSVFDIDIPRELCCIIRGGTTKHDALDQMIDAVCESPAVTDPEAFQRAVHEREAVMSTGIGGGIAVPHVRISEVTEPVLCVGVCPKGLDYGALDNQPVHILVLFAMPKDADKEYLGLLAKVMLALRDKDLFRKLTACRKPSEVHAVLEG